jgi:hypothetical protein
MLWCDPMRITKKFAGASCIGKQVFSKNDDITQKDREVAEQELNALKDAFRTCMLYLLILRFLDNSDRFEIASNPRVFHLNPPHLDLKYSYTQSIALPIEMRDQVRCRE